ncbi:MAG: hypothetical protein H6618_04505 [Deltaproteobacteria bacterium]|nr:hypothetical protein [Deltaproteobacteria bacterium]
MKIRANLMMLMTGGYFLSTQIAWGAQFSVNADCADLCIKIAKGVVTYRVEQPGTIAPDIIHKDNSLSVKHGDSHNIQKCSRISMTIPKEDSLLINLGSGTIKFEESSIVSDSYEISATVGAGEIRSKAPSIEARKFMMTASASNAAGKDKGKLDVVLGAGDIEFN